MRTQTVSLALSMLSVRDFERAQGRLEVMWARAVS